MICRFRGAVSAGAGDCPAVLGIGYGSPVAGGQRMIGVFIGTVPTGGTRHRSAVLCGTVLRPGAVSERMIGIRGSPYIAFTGGAVFSVLMLSGTVFRVLGSCGMVAVGI